MQITILSVDVNTPAGKKYQVAEVAYKDDQGKVNGKKILSFVNKDVFNIAKNAQSGQVYDVSLAKDDQGYWQWTSMNLAGETTISVASPAKATPSPRSTYETPEERAQRQVYIVRQSSLTNAIALANATGDKKATPESIIAVAKQFEAYVFDREFDNGSIETMPEDVIE